MARLLKYIPVLLTLVAKYLRSPRGKALIQRVKSTRHRSGNAGRTRPTTARATPARTSGWKPMGYSGRTRA